jgi:hypothetical protein
MKTRHYTTLPERYGDPVTTYKITPEKVGTHIVYILEVQIGKEAPQRLNSKGNPCESTHRLFEFVTARRAVRRHNETNGKQTLAEIK